MLLSAIRFVQKDTKKWSALLTVTMALVFFTEEHSGSSALHKEHSSSVFFNVTQKQMEAKPKRRL